jgi:excisionase family DNA binding protein
LTVEEAAAYLSVTTRHIRRLVYERRLTHTKVGRLLRFDPDDLDEYLAARRVRGIP